MFDEGSLFHGPAAASRGFLIPATHFEERGVVARGPSRPHCSLSGGPLTTEIQRFPASTGCVPPGAAAGGRPGLGSCMRGVVVRGVTTHTAARPGSKT